MYYQTRSQFSAQDFEFIAQAVGKTSSERAALIRLASDPSSVTELLHDGRLFERAMTKPPVFLSISHSLFFYIILYHALDAKHLADDDVVDYVAGVCVEFRTCHALMPFAAQADEKTVYVVDLLNLMSELDKAQQYHLHRYIGNATLFLTGFFPDFIFRRYKTLGAPSMRYFEKVGSAQFESAAGQSLVYDENATTVLSTLAERFVDIRSAINVLVDNHLNLNSKKRSLEIIERQISTFDEETYRKSLEM